MICLLKLRRQLALTVASAVFTLIVFALIIAFIMILVATSALTLRAAFTLIKDFFNLNKIIKKMSKFFKDRF